MSLTEKDVFIQVRASRRERTLLAGMARKKDLDSSKLVMSWYRKELRMCKAKAELADKTLDEYLKLDKKK